MTISSEPLFNSLFSLGPAYILHSRKYRDSSLIVELFTAKDGRVAGVIRGARKSKSGIVQPFSPLLVAYQGRSDLKTITKIEVLSIGSLVGENLFIGMYVNEILFHLLGKFEATPALFYDYQELLSKLASDTFQYQSLREFEFRLLSELGYGITFDTEAGTGLAIESDTHYRFEANQGFFLAQGSGETTFDGEQLLALSKGDYGFRGVEICAKRIIRISLNALLEGRVLKSRALFKRHPKNNKSLRDV